MLDRSRNLTMTPRAVAALVAIVLLCAFGAPAGAQDARGSAWNSVGSLDPGLETAGDALQAVVVTGSNGVQAAADAVRRAGGSVRAQLHLVDGVEARVPASRLVELSRTPGVAAVTADRSARLSNVSYDDTTTASNFARSTGATAAWAAGNLGKGVGVAVIDSGVSSMNDFAGRLVHGPDLSGEGSSIDTFGHGTVMAGAIAGSGADSAGTPGGAYTGVAPGAHVIAVKVAGRNGVVDVSTMLQAMHFVSAYKDHLGIRVMNLSWGVASTQDHTVDPINYAVERLWKQGIVVVVAAGNSGPNKSTITKPADDPLVISVGAYNDQANIDLGDDGVTSWSSRGPTLQGLTKPDLIVPGRTIISSRSYGSKVEVDNPKAWVGKSYIKGSGTSQAAAVTSGLAALLIAARPALTPDQVKRLLMSTASPIGGPTANDQGSGRVQLARALTADPGPASWQVGAASGLGSLETSRGGRNIVTTCPGATTTTVVKGELDHRCQTWAPALWTGSTWNGELWTGSTWNGSTWNGSTWNDHMWSGSTWNGSTWNGGTWSGSTWNGSTWNGSTWNGSTWNGSTWNGSTWNGSTWNTTTFTTNDFTSAVYEEDDEFLMAFTGDRPKHGLRIAGEVSEPKPAGGRGCQRLHAGC